MAANEMERLTLEHEESDVVVQSEGGEGEEDNIELCLVGRFLTDRMAGVWRPLGGVAIRELEPSLFLFQFFHHMSAFREF